ncbi:MAG: DUF362 domain-containing protein [Spirochaetaceae bacterium]|nr:MAG: DUF362 domain-containing protein [Spirochaetaceae bacterium]
MGERNNDTHVGPDLIKPIVTCVKHKDALPFLTETSTLYRGRRSNAVDHIIQAFDHGFTYEKTGAPFIMADGLFGNSEIEVPIDGVIFDKVNIAREVVFADALITVSHPTGHPGMGLGATLKNLGMGLSSRIGKLRQHSSVKPYVDKRACAYCRKCMQWCPVDAIVEEQDQAFIFTEKCIGCGECLSVCNYDAIRYDWGVESADLQKRVVEHALGVVLNKRQRCFFFSFLIDMTKGCDCFGGRQERIIPDVGILASTDPVAIDQATLDLTARRHGDSLVKKSEPGLDPGIQLGHAEKIGLGSRNYRLEVL